MAVSNDQFGNFTEDEINVTLTLANGKKVKNVYMKVEKSMLVKQVREKLMKKYFDKKEYNIMLQVKTRDGLTHFMDDDDLVWDYLDMIQDVGALELTYVSYTPVFKDVSSYFGMGFDFGMVCGGRTGEAGLVAVEVEVVYPTGHSKIRQLYMLDNPVHETKTILLETEDPEEYPYEPFEDMMLELHFDKKEPMEMFDDKVLREYVHDLTQCSHVEVKRKPVVIM